MQPTWVECLEPRLQFAGGGIQYGVAASGDPSLTGVLNPAGPGLKDLGAQGVRLFTTTSYLSSDFDFTPSGMIYVRNPALVTSLSYAKKYHDAGIEVTLCIELTTDRSMVDGSPLVDAKTGASRRLLPSELRSPKVFRTWYETLSKAQISKTDRTSVTKVLDFWEIGNEPGNHQGEYWPDDATQPDGGLDAALDSYVDHDLIPAYDVLHAIHEPVIGAALGGGTLEQYNHLNNQAGARFHQYSDHCDYLNFHPYGLLNSPVAELTPQGKVLDFINAMYGDGTVTKPFVITEYNLSDFGNSYALDPDPDPKDTADQLAIAEDLDSARTALVNTPHVKERCAWIYYYRLISNGTTRHGALLYPSPDDANVYVPMQVNYDLFKGWARGASGGSTATTKGVLNLGATAVIDAIAVQKDGKTLVLTDDGVRRYDTKGKLDTTYGKSGFEKLPMIGKVAALQGDGNLVVAGDQNDSSSGRYPYHLAVMRLSTSGRVDKGFASHGIYALPDGSGSEARSIALRAGKIVVAGATTSFRDGVIVRLDLAGQPDATFGAKGVAIVKKHGVFSNVAITRSGAITVLVSPYQLSPQTSIARFTNAGALDTTFSKDGITDAQPIAGDGMFVDPDGTVLLLGHAPLAERQVLARYTPAGNLDMSFGNKGVQTLAGKKFIRGSALEGADGSRYLYGSIGSSLTSDTKHIFVSRLLDNRQIDRNFGVKGVLTLSSANVQDLPGATTFDSSGKLHIAAATFTATSERGQTEELFNVSV